MANFREPGLGHTRVRNSGNSMIKSVEVRSLTLASAAFEEFTNSIVLCLSVCVVHQKFNRPYR